jgi:hypothetical protein
VLISCCLVIFRPAWLCCFLLHFVVAVLFVGILGLSLFVA